MTLQQQQILQHKKQQQPAGAATCASNGSALTSKANAVLHAAPASTGAVAGGFVSPHSCNMPGCTRETYNGQQGEQCCRTCKISNGQSHGHDCNGKEDFRKALAFTAAAGPPPSPRHVPSLTSVSDVARQMAAAGATPAANSTSAAPSSTAKPAVSSPFGAAAKPATQGAFGGGFGATTTGTSTFPPLGATTAASPFGAAVSPLTSRSAGPEKSAPPPAEAKDTASQVKVNNAVSSDAIHVIRISCLLFAIVVVYFLVVIYEPRGLVRMTNLPKQTVWNYLRSSRKEVQSTTHSDDEVQKIMDEDCEQFDVYNCDVEFPRHFDECRIKKAECDKRGSKEEDRDL